LTYLTLVSVSAIARSLVTVSLALIPPDTVGSTVKLTACHATSWDCARQEKTRVPYEKRGF